jgi:hypothetical protein
MLIAKLKTASAHRLGSGLSENDQPPAAAWTALMHAQRILKASS